MNMHIIVGNLVRDPETGMTPSGVNWCQFTVAVNRRRPREGEPDAEFIRVTAWRGLGDSCAKYLSKGRKVCVTGESRCAVWSGQKGEPRGQIEMTADSVEFLGGGAGGHRVPGDQDAPPEHGAPVDPESGMTEVTPADLPY